MCRHEAAEALGALSDKGSLDLLKQFRDAQDEPDVITETCQLAVERIEWDHGLLKGQEKIKKRYVARSEIEFQRKVLIVVQRLHID